MSDQQRRNNLATTAVRDELERLFEGPLFAYIQEFRYQPPPVYSEVSIFGQLEELSGMNLLAVGISRYRELIQLELVLEGI